MGEGTVVEAGSVAVGMGVSDSCGGFTVGGGLMVGSGSGRGVVTVGSS